MICGYDAEADEFEIRDPANSRYFLTLLFHCLATPNYIISFCFCFVQGHIIILNTRIKVIIVGMII